MEKCDEIGKKADERNKKIANWKITEQGLEICWKSGNSVQKTFEEIEKHVDIDLFEDESGEEVYNYTIFDEDEGEEIVIKDFDEVYDWKQ